MAGKGINLIPGEERASFEVIEILKKTKFFATIFVSGFVVVLLTFLLVVFRLSSQIKTVSQKIKETEQKINSFKKRETDLVILKDRLGLIKKVIDDRSGSNEILSSFLKLAPEGVEFRVVDSSKKGGLLMTVNSSNLIALNDFLTEISKPEATSKLKMMEISGISRSQLGSYNLIIECQSKK